MAVVTGKRTDLKKVIERRRFKSICKELQTEKDVCKAFDSASVDHFTALH